MPKEIVIPSATEKPLPPSVVFQNPEANGFDEIKYGELKARAIADNTELQDPELLRRVEERIQNLIGSMPTTSVNTFIDLALRHRPAVNSMLNGYVREIKIESQKQKKRLH